MPYCSNCGEEHDEGDVYCPRCGAPLGPDADKRYIKSRGPTWDISRILAVLFGLLMLVTALGLTVGGGGMLWAYSNLKEPDEFLMSNNAVLSVDSYAIVEDGIDIDLGNDIPRFLWSADPGEWLSLRIEARSLDPSKEVFIGIANEQDAEAYLRGVEYDELTSFSWSYDIWDENSPDIQFQTHTGDAPAGPPVIHSFWSSHATGAGTQTLEWDPVPGSFWVVAMNADGSLGVEIETRLGARIPFLRTVGTGLLVAGLILLFLGWLFFRRGLVSRKPF
ncbi:MAG: zinc ribbon domain-containing protein [Candidatus Bathyarchaeota archaeon]|jgi:hypothetical protein